MVLDSLIGLRLSQSIIVLAGMTAASAVFAYPSYIGYGYTSCRSCHFNPLGNGPLTEYGRGVSAAEISGKLFSSATDEALSERSGFFMGAAKTPDWLALEANYRGNWVVSGLERKAVSRWIHMQAEGNLVLRVPGDRVFLSSTFGYVPTRASGGSSSRSSDSNWISREHYLAVVPTESFGIYAGLMDVAFGIRVPDHTSFIRGSSGFNVNDQSHGLLLHYGADSGDLALHALVGNLLQDTNVRQKGACLFGELEAGPNWRLGASLLWTESPFRKRRFGAVFTRLGLGIGSSLLFQISLMSNQLAGQEAALGDAIFAQTWTRLARGVHFIFTLEQFAETLNTAGPRVYRAGPGFVVLPWQRVELRWDLLVTRSTGVTTPVQDLIMTMTQFHLWI